MGNKSSAAKTSEQEALDEIENEIARFSQLSAKMKMTYMLSYWCRQYSLDTLSEDIIGLIVDVFAYQSSFDEKHFIAIPNDVTVNNNARIKKYDHLIKLLLVGHSGIGKSSLMMRYVDDDYTSSFIGTIGVDLKIKTIEMENETIKLHIINVNKHQKATRDFRIVTQPYFAGAYALLMVYDITDEYSFHNVRSWNKRFEEQQCTERNVPKILIGAKCDMINDREVSTSEAEKLCKELNIKHYIEVSAKEGANVSKAFDIITRECYQGIKRTKHPFFG